MSNLLRARNLVVFLFFTSVTTIGIFFIVLSNSSPAQAFGECSDAETVGICADEPQVLPQAGGTCEVEGVTVTSTNGNTYGASPVYKEIYVDDGTNLMSSYVGWSFASATVDFDATDLWIRVNNFSSPTLGLNANQPAFFPVRGTSASGDPLAYVFLSATSVSASPITMNVELWDGNPTLGNSTLICTQTDGVSAVEDVLIANANKPAGVTLSGSPVLGGTFTMTVTGNSGTLGAGTAVDPYLFFMTPSMGQNWPAGDYVLTDVQTTFATPPVGSPSVYDDVLRINFPSTMTSDYSTVYTFYTRGISGSFLPTPRMNIASGTQIKMTNTADASTVQTIPAGVSPVDTGAITRTLTASTDWSSSPKTTTYTLTLTNTTSEQFCFDAMTADVAEDPATWSFVNGSTTLNGAPWTQPNIAGQTATFGTFCAAPNDSTVITFQIELISDITTTVDTVIGSTVVTGDTVSSAGEARLKVHVDSTGFLEDYDGVTVEVAQNGGAFTYKTGITDINGNWGGELGEPIDTNAAYTVRLTAPCDNQPQAVQTSFNVTTGTTTENYTLTPTVPCAPTLSYDAGTDTMSWTEPNDGGSFIRYYTYHYTTQERVDLGQRWGMFARYWPLDLREVDFNTYASAGCPTTPPPAPYNDKLPDCVRGLGTPTPGSPYLWRVAARNGMATPGEVAPQGIGWGPFSPTITFSRS